MLRVPIFKNDVIIIFMLILTETNMFKYKMLKKLNPINSIIVYLVFNTKKNRNTILYVKKKGSFNYLQK